MLPPEPRERERPHRPDVLCAPRRPAVVPSRAARPLSAEHLLPRLDVHRRLGLHGQSNAEDDNTCGHRGVPDRLPALPPARLARRRRRLVEEKALSLFRALRARTRTRARTTSSFDKVGDDQRQTVSVTGDRQNECAYPASSPPPAVSPAHNPLRGRVSPPPEPASSEEHRATQQFWPSRQLLLADLGAGVAARSPVSTARVPPRRSQPLVCCSRNGGPSAHQLSVRHHRAQQGTGCTSQAARRLHSERSGRACGTRVEPARDLSLPWRVLSFFPSVFPVLCFSQSGSVFFVRSWASCAVPLQWGHQRSIHCHLCTTVRSCTARHYL